MTTVFEKYAGTDNYVYIKFYGDECESQSFELDNPDKNDMEPGYTDRFYLRSIDIGNQVSSQIKIQQMCFYISQDENIPVIQWVSQFACLSVRPSVRLV